VGNMRA